MSILEILEWHLLATLRQVLLLPADLILGSERTLIWKPDVLVGVIYQDKRLTITGGIPGSQPAVNGGQAWDKNQKEVPAEFAYRYLGIIHTFESLTVLWQTQNKLELPTLKKFMEL